MFTISDHRRGQGRKFRLAVLLAIWQLARLSGYHGVDATSRYACHLTQDELRTLGAWCNKRTGHYHPPSRATLHRAMTDTDPDAFQAAIDRWLAARSPTTTALAADGKRLRGANRQCDAEYQTVSLVSHHDKQPISSRIFTDTGGEIAAVFALLEDADISGSVITLDALHTTRDTATAILHRHHAHYLLSVKGNASETYAALDTIDWDQDATASFCEQLTKGHGRIEQRHIQTMKSVPGMLNYPQVKQVFRIIRHRHTITTGVDSSEVAYGITSLSPESADAQRLLALNRGHWTVENLNHRFRDTTFAEDACLMHTGHGPSNNAILNNTALAVIFHRGSNSVAAAVQEFAMDRSQAIRALTEPG